jgi:hypothetical protein
MSDFLAFLQLGFGHIVARDAADHILFLLVLAAIYRGRDWRAALLVISAFTVGHSVTLLLAVTNMLVLPSSIVEFLIPVTIVATAVENIVLRDRAARGSSARHRPAIAVIFGLVHGAGFAGYLRSLFMDDIAMPLLGFNVGIELGQIVVLGAAAMLFVLLDAALQRVRRASWPAAFQLRVITVSTTIAVLASGWAAERFPQ